MFRMILKDMRIEGGVLMLEEQADSPMFIGCMFVHCKIKLANKEMMKAFGHCIFKDCEFVYRDEEVNG